MTDDDAQDLRELAEQNCSMCLGQGAHTCEACGGSCAAPGSDPVTGDRWYRCRDCAGQGWVICACLERRRERIERGEPPP